jgi:serine/threonine-protein kinase
VVEAVFHAALACEPAGVDAFLRDACGSDDALRREIESLLAAHERVSETFLEQPAAGTFAARPGPNERQAAALAEALAGRYAMERELAHGGMATVYLARDLRHNRRVAIKVMRDEVAAAVGAQRFLEEIRVTALLQHPHILPLFDSGSAAGLLWYVMPFADGETLRSRLTRDGRLPIDEAVQIAGQIADALAHAHAHGIVHRDIKPENVLLQGGHALVADFGIALALERAGGERLTRTGLTLGTPQYMSPEQARGERALDARVDIYGLGAVLHEMITGEPPFAAESRQVMLLRILQEPPPALVARRPDVWSSLDAAVQRALAKRPEDRFPNATAFAAALVRPAKTDASSSSHLASTNGPPTRNVMRARLAVYTGVGGIVVGLVSGWGLAHSPVNRWASQREAFAQSVPSVISVQNSSGSTDGISLVVVDRTGRIQHTIAANRPWTPRFSPDGHRVAFGAFGAGRSTSDIWVTDLEAGTTQRLTDDDADSNDPQWSPDGSAIAYSVSAPGGKDVAERRLDGTGVRLIASREGTQFPNDWVRDGSALLVTDDHGAGSHDIIVQPTNGSVARPYVGTTADELAARISPDGHWVAYTSDEGGPAQVYLDSYPRIQKQVQLSKNGGVHPVWRADGRELYYWRGNALVALQLGPPQGSSPPSIIAETVLFRAPYLGGLNTMYDVAPDGSRFVIVEHVDR